MPFPSNQSENRACRSFLVFQMSKSIAQTKKNKLVSFCRNTKKQLIIPFLLFWLLSKGHEFSFLICCENDRVLELRLLFLKLQSSLFSFPRLFFFFVNSKWLEKEILLYAETKQWEEFFWWPRFSFFRLRVRYLLILSVSISSLVLNFTKNSWSVIKAVQQNEKKKTLHYDRENEWYKRPHNTSCLFSCSSGNDIFMIGLRRIDGCRNQIEKTNEQQQPAKPSRWKKEARKKTPKKISATFHEPSP